MSGHPDPVAALAIGHSEAINKVFDKKGKANYPAKVAIGTPLAFVSIELVTGKKSGRCQMGRVFSRAEAAARYMLSHEISYLTEQLNQAIAKAVADGYVPDVSVSNTPLLLSGQQQPLDRLFGLEQPLVEVWFFRPGDSTDTL